jgi:hypothetical protein
MSMAASIFANARTNQGPANPTTQVQQNTRGDLCVAQGLLPKVDLTRLGNSWQASIPTGSAFTTVAAWPTTRAELILSNANPAGGKSFVIDQIWAATIVTETAASQMTLLAQMSGAGLVAVAANNTAVLVTSLSGKAGVYGGAASLALANTAFMIASKWQVVGVSPLGGASVSVGQAALAEMQGGYIVQPQSTLGVNLVVGTAVASAGLMGISWHEVQLDVL